ncbi:MAG: aminoglycoside phosphotransferase family protein [Lachnospiraceae bacterium]|nr:aminoglycoside phosphotransferase family protein [Lachnospiraceae bacterium]
MMKEEKAKKAVKHFFPRDLIQSVEPYGSGHINSTFLLKEMDESGERRYILQKINTDIFRNPEGLMENIRNVTEYLRKAIIENGGDQERETLNIVLTTEGKPFYRDEEGECWRVYKFIEDAISYDLVEKPEDFYESAVAFGNFQRLLADYPAETLFETIPKFHDTWFRYQTFEQSVQKDVCGRAAEVSEEIAFVRNHMELAKKLGRMQEAGELPLRVTHNDTKLNNIMIDEKTRRGICVIDLDTVMPGLAVNDFGDSIRFGANTAYEDETDLTKVSCSLELFELYTKGFLEGLNGSLTKKEIDMLPTGAMAMTFECGMRFLTDYLDGDTYFNIHRPGHNLDRCRCQFALLADMERKESQLDAVIQKYSKICQISVC